MQCSALIAAKTDASHGIVKATNFLHIKSNLFGKAVLNL